MTMQYSYYLGNNLQNATNRPNKGEEVIVWDEALAEGFVEAGHWQGDHVGAEPDKKKEWHPFLWF